MRELDVLFERFWIARHQDKDLFFSIKDASPKFKDFIEEKLGYKLIINPYMIRLEKLPGRPEPWMGIADFENKNEYAYFCVLLGYLEDKGAGEQFVLSQIAEYIEVNFPGDEKPDWTLFRHRKYLVRVLKFSSEMGIIRVDDGDESAFMDTVESEVLYESTGLSRYFVRNFTGNIINYQTAEDIENGEWINIDRDKGRVRRNRVYRRIFMSPAVYSEGAEDPDYLYIKNFRTMIQKDVEDYIGGRFYVYKNGAFLFLDQTNYRFKDVFPDNKGICDIVLQLCGIVGEKIRTGEFAREENDTFLLSRVGFEKLISQCRDLFMMGWGKEYREMPLLRLCNEIIGYMELFMMIDVVKTHKEIRILPIIGKFEGRYPKDFEAKIDEAKVDEAKIDYMITE